MITKFQTLFLKTFSVYLIPQLFLHNHLIQKIYFNCTSILHHCLYRMFSMNLITLVIKLILILIIYQNYFSLNFNLFYRLPNCVSLIYHLNLVIFQADGNWVMYFQSLKVIMMLVWCHSNYQPKNVWKYYLKTNSISYKT